MPWHRINAILLQEWYITKRSLEVIMDLFFTSLIGVLLFGGMSVFLSQRLVGPERHYLLLGMLLWEVVRVAQYSLSVGAMWNVWSRNLSNLFIAPLSVTEFITAQIISGTGKAIAVLALVGLIAHGLFGFNLLWIGLPNLIATTVNLLLFAFSCGLLILGLIFMLGTRIQALAWGLIFLFQPLTAALFPLEVLPPLLRGVALLFPPTYAFEAARHGLNQTGAIGGLQAMAFGLNIGYAALALAGFAWMLGHSRATGQFARNEL